MKLMGGKIKNLGAHLRMQMGGGGGRVVVFNFIWTKKQLILAVLFFVFLGLILPSQFAQAGFLDVLAAIPVSIINVLFQVILLISNLVLSLAGLLLGWVVGPYFTTLPYTYGGVVDIGWPLVRDFINMFFIIALVIIGLSTALRIKEYQAQKALPRLIIIAILINFTPVICGLIVDASNILMNFFLEELAGFRTFLNFMGMQVSSLWQALRPSCFFDIGCAASALGKTIVMTIFGFVAAYIFLLYTFLFIMRYVMIWALVIISPIAFFSNIFPAAQKHLFKSILGWEEWWKAFIEWSLMGVIAGFFLYLAEQLMRLSPSMFSGRGLAPGEGGWVGNPIVEFVNNFLPWMVVLVFLQIGYKITKSTSAMGAQGIIKAVDTGLKVAATAAVVAATGGAAAGLAAKGLAGAARGAQRMEAFVGKLPVLGKPLKYGLVTPTSWALRGIEKAAVPPLLEYQAKTRRVPEADLKKIDGMSGTEAEAYIKTKTKMLPKGIAEKKRLQYQARMAEKETLEFTSSGLQKDGTLGFQDDAAANARSIFADKNPYYQKEAMAVAKNLPDKVFEGGKVLDREVNGEKVTEGESAYGEMKSLGKKDKPGDSAYTNAYNDAVAEVRKNRADVLSRLKGDDNNLIIETGLKFKYITKDDVVEDRAAAILKAKNDIITISKDLRGELDRTANEMAVKVAPAVTFIVDKIKPADVKKIADPKTLGTRIGLSLGNPSNLQQLQDNFGRKVVEDIFNGTGGINSLTKTELKKINATMYKFLNGTAPVAQRMPWNPKS